MGRGALRCLLPLPAFLYTGWIFIAGTGPAGPELQRYNDKLLHFLGFAVCTWLYALALYAFGSALERWRLGLSWAGATAVGVGLEVWQSFVPARSADWADLVADVLGATAAIVALKFLEGRWPWSARRA